MVLRPSEAIAANTELQLRLEPEAIQDLFGIPLAAPLEQTITWQPTADTVIADTAPPEVSHVVLRGPRLEIRFTEPVVAEDAEAAIFLDGEPRLWTVSAEGEVWTTPTDLADGDHTLSIAATPLDLAGNPLAVVFERTFRIEPTHLGLIVYRRPDPTRLPTSATGTALTFQGLELDSETGLLYVRNRYFDPELGRFITADPMGYPDGPNGYAFGAGDAVNGRDPMGLQEGAEIRQRQGVAEQLGHDPLRGREAAEGIRRALADPYVQGTLQILGGCSEATLGAIAAAGSAGLAAAPGLLAVLHGSDTCAAGFRTIYYGKNQNNLTVEGVKVALISSGVSVSRAELGANVFDAILGAGLSANAARSLLPGARAAVVPKTGAKPTNQEILDLGKGPLSRKAAAELRNDVLQDANFAQKTFSQAFDLEGAFAGRTVDDVAAALRSGQMSAADVPIEYIVRDGNTLILNTRSAQALEAAGIPRAQWNAVNMTGNAAAEARLTGQLQRNGLSSQGTPTVTPGRR